MSTAGAPPIGETAGRRRDVSPTRGRFRDALAAAGSTRALERSGPEARTTAGRATVPAAQAAARKPRAHAEPEGEPRSAVLFPAGSTPPGPSACGPGDPAGTAELRACIRAAPPVIAAALRPGSAGLALELGAALSLDVRAGAHGLELTLRPATGLERATRAELPGLVDALRARGLRVARADVRPRASATPRRAR